MPAIAIPVVGGLLVGLLTSWMQSALPTEVSSFANSSGGWSMLAFVLVWAGRGRPLLSSLLGVACFLAMLEGYDLMTAWRGFGYVAPFNSVFWFFAFVAGPVLGVSAAVARHGTDGWRVMAVAPLSGVLIGEGVWSLHKISDVTSPVYWGLEIILGCAFLGLAIIRRRPAPRVIVAAAVSALLVAATFIGVYELASGPDPAGDIRLNGTDN